MTKHTPEQCAEKLSAILVNVRAARKRAHDAICLTLLDEAQQDCEYLLRELHDEDAA